MGDAYPKCDPWACDQCATAVFIPRSAAITGAVCTQQAKGCKGDLVKLDDEVATALRAKLARIGQAERPWLTLVFVLSGSGAGGG